jgi:hypothetical protein
MLKPLAPHDPPAVESGFQTIWRQVLNPLFVPIDQTYKVAILAFETAS